MTISSDYTTISYFKRYSSDIVNYLSNIEGKITVYYDFRTGDAIMYVEGDIEDNATNLTKLLSLVDRNSISINIVQRYQQLWLPFNS